MVLLTTTPSILSAIESLSSSSSSSEEEDSSVLTRSSLPQDVNTPISHTQLIALSKTLLLRAAAAPQSSSSSTNKISTSSPFTLNALLRGTKPYISPAAASNTPAPSAEYLALKAKLLRDQEKREYARLTNAEKHNKHLLRDTFSAGFKGGDANANADEDEGDEDDDITPSLVFNILLSIVLCAFAAFHVTRHWHNDGVRVLVALGTGLVVGVAEVAVYAAYLRKVSSARRRERRKRERKELLPVEESVLPPPSLQPSGATRDVQDGDALSGRVIAVNTDDNIDVQPNEILQEHIWGRGVNGGVRRRVREKWEKENVK